MVSSASYDGEEENSDSLHHFFEICSIDLDMLPKQQLKNYLMKL